MVHPSMSIGDSLIGTTLVGRYRVEARVGSGAMGAVYRAEQAGLGRSVALKILNRDRSVGGDTVQRFRREAQALSALHHPNTVRVFDFGATDEGLLFLAMELLEGEPLTDCMVRQGPLPVLEAVLITQQVLRSIGEAHARGIVHRDLKPDNVFLARVPNEAEPIVKVLDFGIAKATDGERTIDQFETLDGTVFGTPRYMSPEQAAGKPLGPRSDLYAVGIMLYELLSGRPPFVDNDAVVVMARHIREEPMLVCRAAPGQPIPASLEAVVTRSLAKHPADRFQSAEEFERALQACLPAAARLAKLAKRGLHDSLLARIWLAPKRKLWAGAAAAAALLLLAGSTAALLSTPDSDAMLAKNDTRGLPRAPESQSNRDTAALRSVVSLQTEPAAAAVFHDGAELGVTPLDVSMNAGSTLKLLLRKRGFAERTLELRSEDRTRLVTLRPLPDKPTRPAAPARQKRERTRRTSQATVTDGADTANPVNPAAATPSTTGTPSKGSPYEKF
jgi:serine/threonine-protein kinase